MPQIKMKRLYDCRSEHREYSSGDQVPMLVPVVSSLFQAKFTGPYTVAERFPT